MARRKPKDAQNKAVPVATVPLSPPEREAFVRYYRDSFDGEGAARSAGYKDAGSVWPSLLADPEVQARLRGYRSGVDMPARTPDAMFEHLYAQAFKGVDKILVPDPITGEIRIDWEEAAAQNGGALEFEQSISDRGGIPQRVTRIRKRGNLDILRAVAGQLTEIATAAPTEEDFRRSFFESILQNATSTPVVTDKQVRQRKEKEPQRAKPDEAAQDDPEP